MATPSHSQRSQVKEYSLSQCTFLSKCIPIRNRSPFLIRPSLRTGAPSPRGNVINLSAKVPSTTVIARSEATWQSVFSLVTGTKSGRCKGERIAAPVCALARNDRENGAWFLKLMTLPPGEGIVRHSSLQIPIYRAAEGNRYAHLKTSPEGIPHLISDISYLKSSFPAPSAAARDARFPKVYKVFTPWHFFFLGECGKIQVTF